MQFFRKIKFNSILGCIENGQNIVTSGRKWRSRNLKFACFPIEGLFGTVHPVGQIKCSTRANKYHFVFNGHVDIISHTPYIGLIPYTLWNFSYLFLWNCSYLFCKFIIGLLMIEGGVLRYGGLQLEPQNSYPFVGPFCRKKIGLPIFSFFSLKYRSIFFHNFCKHPKTLPQTLTWTHVKGFYCRK